jgi:GH15 family glucan-1,4-alpha-glucosidase
LTVPVDPQRALSGTETFWRDWASRRTPAAEWSDAVTRSLITLKALTYRPTSGIVAAPTTSLPEQLIGQRKWDHRFCWLRDATFTLPSLMNSGSHEEARAWHTWLLRAAADNPAKVQIVYGITRWRRLTEWEVASLPGYGSAKPARIGNAASSPVPLDIYGEVMDALHQTRGGKLAAKEAGGTLQRGLLDHLERIWEQPDHGIWEMRGDPQQVTCSKVMAWVAFDRALKSAEQFDLDGSLDRWRGLRQRIHDDVCRNGFSSESGAFVQTCGSRDLDASFLLIPLVGFLPSGDSRSKVSSVILRVMVSY